MHQGLGAVQYMCYMDYLLVYVCCVGSASVVHLALSQCMRWGVIQKVCLVRTYTSL